MVLRVVYQTFTEEFLKSFVINLVSLPTYVNFAHFDPVCNSFPWVLGGIFIVNMSYLFFCRMCLMMLFSFSLLAVFRWYVFILLVRYITAASLCSVGWQESCGIMESVVVGFL